MKIKIAYLINHSSFFVSHIYPIALQASKNNYEVKLFCGAGGSIKMEKYAEKFLKKNQIKFEKYKFSAANLNIFVEFISFWKLLMAIKSFNPSILHAATSKGILYGGLIGIILNIKGLVLFVTGLGYLFSNKLNTAQKIAKCFYLNIVKLIFKKKNLQLIIENKNDYNYYRNKYNLKNKIKLIKGSGVDTLIFKPEKKKKKLVILPSRVLKEKGITEFANAAFVLKKKFPQWEFVIIGALDYKKTSAYTKIELAKLKKKSVKFVGYSNNMLKFYREASIVCLPSYREGFSKSLVEASACGIPIVTTNVTGCRDVIVNKKSGLLCKVQDVNSLKKQIEFLIRHKDIRIKYGNFGAKLAKKNYDIKIIVNKNLEIYKKLIANYV